MVEGGTKVFNLFEDNDRRELKNYVERELERVDGEMEKTRRTQEVLREADEALSEIQALLATMKQIAQKAAADPQADRAALSIKFEALKKEIEQIAEQRCARWSAAETAHIRKLVADLNSELL